jgi:hypothetical protein
LVGEANRLRREGLSLRKIAEQVGLSHPSVHRLLGVEQATARRPTEQRFVVRRVVAGVVDKPGGGVDLGARSAARPGAVQVRNPDRPLMAGVRQTPPEPG